MCEPYSAQRMSGFLNDIRQEILAGKSDKAITMLLHLADVIYPQSECCSTHSYESYCPCCIGECEKCNSGE
jgi:hypothetical protein